MKSLKIKGFIDLSLVDWDGKVSAVLFLPFCNFRCPFCYNNDFVLRPEEMPTIEYEEIKQYLLKNRDWLDGVTITGGEPTIHQELPILCRRIKELGFRVKLDTNGSNSQMIKELIDQALVDYVAMDIKTPLTVKDYSKVVNVNTERILTEIKRTTKVLLESKIGYEFRTTLVPTLHNKNNIKLICQKIKGCRKYILQNFKSDVKTLDPSFQNIKPFSQNEMEEFVKLAQKITPNTSLR